MIQFEYCNYEDIPGYGLQKEKIKQSKWEPAINTLLASNRNAIKISCDPNNRRSLESSLSQYLRRHKEIPVGFHRVENEIYIFKKENKNEDNE